MNLTTTNRQKDRRIKKNRVVPFTFYLDPVIDRRVRAFAKGNDLTLTQVGNRALRMLLDLDRVAS